MQSLQPSIERTTCLIGLDPEESTPLRADITGGVIVHPMLPAIQVRDGHLYVQRPNAMSFVRVDQVIYHGIFEDDHDLIAALALWGGPCLPNAHGMMDCRLKLPCLVRALAVSRYGSPRGYTTAGTRYPGGVQRVAKWGNWHCGENKARFDEPYTADANAIIEPYFEGNAVRVVLVGDEAWQIALEGQTWLKSIHADNAAITEIDTELLEDTRVIGRALGLDIVANDYIITHAGERRLLEVNHIPNVTRFEPIREAYLAYAAQWANRNKAMHP